MAEPTLDSALAAKKAKDTSKPKPLRFGAIRGEAANVVRKACEQAGIKDVPSHVRGLLLADLKARLSAQEPAPGAEKPEKPAGKPKAAKKTK